MCACVPEQRGESDRSLVSRFLLFCYSRGDWREEGKKKTDKKLRVLFLVRPSPLSRLSGRKGSRKERPERKNHTLI